MIILMPPNVILLLNMILEYAARFAINNLIACKLQHPATEETIRIFCNELILP
jgi:hypothetical protein